MPHYRWFKKFLIGSQWVDPHGIIDHVVSNPAHGEEIGVVRLADDLDLDRAAAAARGAWENRVWSDLTLEQRAEQGGAARAYCAGQDASPVEVTAHEPGMHGGEDQRRYGGEGRG